ncbi:expressed protein [Phakopsora pachyrhizi]|uniref:Expressed protein n=1 Tax=Phakopsora pachyrhizi TaxID=170000 RepID=A0AAV0AHZ9_PHAPC|nr:expressed protein [Phakopsora pachyrhizi]
MILNLTQKYLIWCQIIYFHKKKKKNHKILTRNSILPLYAQSSSKSTAISSSSSFPHPFTHSPSSISFLVLQQIIKAQPTLLTFLISNNGSHSAINPNQAYKLFPHAAADLASRLDSTPTPLSPRIASVVTAASLATRLSLQSSALVIQLIFETLRYLSTASLGIS